jgi:ATP-dependent DNA ligase
LTAPVAQSLLPVTDQRARLILPAHDATALPGRRETLELLGFGNGCHVSPRFDDGTALWESVCERRLEGVVAKREQDPYRPGERGWVKQKNPGWPRYAAEGETVTRQRAR